MAQVPLPNPMVIMSIFLIRYPALCWVFSIVM